MNVCVLFQVFHLVHFECPAQIEEASPKDLINKSENAVGGEEVLLNNNFYMHVIYHF